MIALWTRFLAWALLVNVCLGSKAVDGPLTPDNFPYSENLDTNYRLQWKFNASHIMFKTTVKTNGFIGFGISDHSKMFPSDVIVGWVKDGEVHFKDRHTLGYYMPLVDSQQDWYLVNSSEEGEYTSLTMVRKFDTCDDEDKVITSGTTRVIFSYSPIDPPSDDYIGYHGSNRGTKSLLLLDPPADDKALDHLPDDVTIIDFLNHNDMMFGIPPTLQCWVPGAAACFNGGTRVPTETVYLKSITGQLPDRAGVILYSVPSDDTTYSCVAYKLPPLKGKHHMIRFEPVIQKGHEKLVHHMLLYFCRTSFKDSRIGYQYRCYRQEEPPELRDCEHVILAWAIGGTAFDFPAHVGYSLGDVDDPVYFRLETHYDNPQMRSDFVDSSGLRMFLTKELRQHDAGMLEVGLNVDNFHIIPPHYQNFLSQGYCAGECFDNAVGDGEIHIFGDLLHSHLLGTKLTTRHIRNGTELAPILQDDHYDFDFQEVRLLREEKTVRKGDRLITDCVYDTSKKSSITYGGLSTREEMCLSFMLYYPKIPLSSCLSRPIYNTSDVSSIQSMDFTKQSVRNQFVDMIEDNILYVCLRTDNDDFGLAATPTISNPYVKESHCKNDN